MRNILPYRFLILIIFIFLSTGCAMTAKVAVIMPAESGEIMEYRKVAVFNFIANSGDGNKNGAAYSSAFENKITSASIDNKKIFTVLDRENIDKILKEQKFQLIMSEDTSIVEAGRLLGAQAIWTGIASEDYVRDSWYETQVFCSIYDNGSCVVYDSYRYQCIAQDISVSVTPKLTDVATGKVVYSNTFLSKKTASACKYDLNGTTRADLWNKSMLEILNNFRKQIAPYVKISKVELMKSTAGIEDKNAKTLFKEGIKYMNDNKTAEACSVWRKALDIKGESVSLNYNVAICDEIDGNYEKALDKLLYTKKIDKKNEKLVSDAIERNMTNQRNGKLVEEQLLK